MPSNTAIVDSYRRYSSQRQGEGGDPRELLELLVLGTWKEKIIHYISQQKASSLALLLR